MGGGNRRSFAPPPPPPPRSVRPRRPPSRPARYQPPNPPVFVDDYHHEDEYHDEYYDPYDSRTDDEEKVELIDDNLAPLMTVSTSYLERRFDSKRFPYVLEAGAPPRAANEKARPTDPWSMNVLSVTTHYTPRSKESHRVLAIRSPYIKRMLQHEIGETWFGISFLTAVVEVTYPLAVFYHNYDKITAAVEKIVAEQKDTPGGKAEASHLQFFVKFLTDEFAEIKKERESMIKKGVITYELLWTLFQKGDVVYTLQEGEPLIATVTSVSDHYQKKTNAANRNPPPPRPLAPARANNAIYPTLYDFSVDVDFTDHDGFGFGMSNTSVCIGHFNGTRRINHLRIYPLEFHRNEAKIKARLIERGKKFESLQGSQCKQYKGVAIDIDEFDFVEPTRIMLDMAAYGKEFPGNRPYVRGFPLSRDEERKLDEEFSARKLDEKFVEDEKYASSDSEFEDVASPKDRKERIKSYTEATEIKLTDEQLMQCPCSLPGFSFSEKKWMWFKVDDVSDVDWDTTAFESLVLPDIQKDLIRALVESHLASKTNHTGFDDLIKNKNKGRGFISVIHGPPGVGKTLTAESIADFINRPLYSVSSGELGTNAQDLQFDLKRIFDLASQWDAVLLLDEADVFLEERAPRDIERNALVSIFLKLIEYYPGILFLTSNRVKVFDPAFYSRIHVAMQYKDLDLDSRRKVWKNFIERTGADKVEISAVELEELAARQVNGREIKNCMRIAQGLSEHKGEKLAMKHIKPVLTLAEEFDKGMKEIGSKN